LAHGDRLTRGAHASRTRSSALIREAPTAFSNSGTTLIITNREDLTADLVVLELRRRSLPFVRFNTEDFPGRARITLGSHPIDDTLELPKGALRLGDVRSVWYRRPVAPRPAGVGDDGARDFAISEGVAAIEDLWARLDVLWVSPPAAISAATPRLAQLRIAQKLGLAVPPTLVTNDAGQARAFIQTHGRVVTKAIGVGMVPGTGASADRLAFTHLLEPAEIEGCIKSLDVAPILLQRFEPKAADIRVTVVGDRVFGTKITAPSHVSIDWRAADLEDLRHEAYELPREVEESLVLLVDSLGLKFGAIDFLLRPDGGLVFLEINPNGQWAWIEQDIGTPIAAALVDVLTSVPTGTARAG
jgi:glutathione synthase/RimK-type ligase-like ATP-grasp enzyme